MKLVAYFSRNGENYTRNGIENLSVGNTEVVAKKIAELIGADLFKIETVKDYPVNYHETTEVAQVELRNNARPELKKYLTDVDKYLFFDSKIEQSQVHTEFAQFLIVV